MTAPAPMYVIACAAQHVQTDGTCTVPVAMPYHQPVLPPLTLAEGWMVAIAIASLWAIALKAKLIFRAARMGNF